MIRFASRYPTRFLRSYVRVKTTTDPVYEGVFESLGNSTEPLLDVGCGIGVLALYLRERGFTSPIIGIDFDARKIDIANTVANGDRGISFRVADARKPFGFRGNVAMLDVLHYFTTEEQLEILDHAVEATGTGGMVVIRDGIRDGTLRYGITYVQESLSRIGGWLKAERLNFPTREVIEQPFRGAFHEEFRPMSGRMPFNNYLFVFRRSSAGITNV